MISSTASAEKFHSRLNAVVEAAVSIAAQRHRSPVAPDVGHLSMLFTSDRGSRAKTYMRDPALRRAYLAFFVPHNVARIAFLLQRLEQDGALGALAKHDAPSVLDVGAGPLSGLLAAWVVWGRVGDSAAVDLSRAALEDGCDILRAVGADVSALDLIDRSIAAPPRAWLPQRKTGFDVVIAANVLNEISDPREVERRVSVVDSLVRVLTPGGRLLIVEPSLRVEARALMGVRDEVVAAEVASVMSPCRGATECPLLKTRGDWCHGEFVWPQRPAVYRELERQVGLSKDVLSTSHLLLAATSEAAPTTGLRLVGGMMRADRDRRYACGRELVTIEGRPLLPPSMHMAPRGSLVSDDAVNVPVIERQAPRPAAPATTAPTTKKTATPAPSARPARNAGGAPARGQPPTKKHPPSTPSKKKPPRGRAR